MHVDEKTTNVKKCKDSYRLELLKGKRGTQLAYKRRLTRRSSGRAIKRRAAELRRWASPESSLPNGEFVHVQC